MFDPVYVLSPHRYSAADAKKAVAADAKQASIVHDKEEREKKKAEWHDHRMETNAGRDEEKVKQEEALSQKHNGKWNVDEHCLMTKGERCEKKFCKHRYYESWSCCGSTDFASPTCPVHVKKYHPERKVKKDDAKKRLKEVQGDAASAYLTNLLAKQPTRGEAAERAKKGGGKG